MLDVIDALESFSSTREQVKSLASAVARYADSRPNDFAWAMDQQLPLSPHHIVLAMAVAMVHEGAVETSYRIGSQANDNDAIVLAYANHRAPTPIHRVRKDEQQRTVARSLELSARSFELLEMTDSRSTFLGRSKWEKTLLS
jgi:predicted ribonuclease YlaK